VNLGSRPPAFPDGGAGLVSTVDDYLAFGQMLLNRGILGSERILSRPSVQTMTIGQLTPEQKRSVINYVQTIKAQADPGGAGIGRIGPVSEGLVIWVVGIGALLFGIFWMGTKA